MKTHQDPRMGFLDPPREYGMMPFWLWNDDLQEAELLRQLQELHAAGYGGVVIHPRIGLSRRVGYLTDEWFRLVRIVVAQAARLGMKVILYDEGSYPSGSAQGRVVAENPAFASRCLFPVELRIDGPSRGLWRPNPGRALADELLVVAKATFGQGDRIDPDSLECLEVGERELVAYDLPQGRHVLLSVWAGYSGATIRGVFEEEEDGHALAPAAGDLMNPDAVACFVRHTHERYYEQLHEHFGSTVVAMFTDEPSPLGRSPRRRPDPQPYTPGLLEELARLWGADVRKWLPALWLDAGGPGAAFRTAYRRAIAERIRSVFYAAQSRWCEGHGIALTGHPARSNEMAVLRFFGWPGQDMVWRYVEPGTAAAMEGPHSLAPRAASSAAALWSRPRAASELYGAYGWRLSLDEMKWLMDWHLVRGVNLMIPHACFYSIRGRRAFESEPDVGLHNTLWPAIRRLASYASRMCACLSGGREVFAAAILTDPEGMAWEAARLLTESQMGFAFIGPEELGRAELRDGKLLLGEQSFGAVVCDPEPAPGGDLGSSLDRLESGRLLVLRRWQRDTLVRTIASRTGRPVEWHGEGGTSLRCLHYRKGEADLFILVNEGEERLSGELTLRPGAAIGADRALERWDAWRGTVERCPAAREGDRLRTELCLERRESAVLALLPEAAGAAPPARPGPGRVLLGLARWTAFDDGGKRLDLPAPGDWARLPGWETFSGSVIYRSVVELEQPEAEIARFLDLGAVGEIAEGAVNGKSAGVATWAPYLLDIGGLLQRGRNELELRVSNSMANAMDGLRLPSGLMGPVALRAAEPQKS